MFRCQQVQATQLHVCYLCQFSRNTPRLHHRSEQIFLSRTMVAMSRSSACCPRLSRREITEMKRWKKRKRWKNAKENAKETFHAFFLELVASYFNCACFFATSLGPYQHIPSIGWLINEARAMFIPHERWISIKIWTIKILPEENALKEYEMLGALGALGAMHGALLDLCIRLHWAFQQRWAICRVPTSGDSSKVPQGSAVMEMLT